LTAERPSEHDCVIVETDLVLSDSGGVQEETPALGISLLILRTTTERPEGLASGNRLLVGIDGALIVRTLRYLLDHRAAYRAMAVPALPFGDCQTAARIAAICADHLAAKQSKDRVLTA
jgi:UDP-N-acetylglucosamine 2-epimerase (non-hydrolysing)